MSDISTLETAAWVAGKRAAIGRFIRLAAVSQLSEFLGQSAEDLSSPLRSYDERANELNHLLTSIWRDGASGIRSGERADTALKLQGLLPAYAPLTDKRKKEIEIEAWYQDLTVRAILSGAVCAASFLPQLVNSVVQTGNAGL